MTFNKANELTTINGGTAHVGFDPAGNMTTVPKVGDEPDDHWTCTYDAWNRLVKVYYSVGEVGCEFQYDGLNRGAAKLGVIYDWDQEQWVPQQRRDYFYNESWQVLEERKGAVSTLVIGEQNGPTSASNSDPPESRDKPPILAG